MKTLLGSLLVVLALGCLTGAASADVLYVPGSYPTLQLAIDNALPDDVIVVKGGTHGPIVIDKPLSIVGVEGNRPLIRGSQPPNNPPFQQGPITLAGPDAGRVTLAELDIGGTVDGSFYGGAGDGISGSGFAELHVLACDVSAPDWIQLTGVGFGARAIAADLPYLLVEDSVVTGGQPENDDFWASGSTIGGADAIDLGSGLVVVLDSVVRGGEGLDTQYNVSSGCPGSCKDVTGGNGGAGIRAASVMQANSVVKGGKGALVRCFSAVAGPQFICRRPPGEPFSDVLEYEGLPGLLIGSGPLIPGSAYRFTWWAESNGVLLLLSPFSAPPLQLGLKGQLFLQLPGLILLSLPGGGLQTATFDVSLDPSLAGFPLALQILDGNTLSRPTFSVQIGV